MTGVQTCALPIFGLGSRVTFAGYLADAQLLDHLARCRAVVFPPIGEDYGFVTVEAFSSAKSVLTCADSGGPVELVKDGDTGFIVAAQPAAMAAAMAKLMDSPSDAQRMGARAAETAAAMTWPAALQKLLIV